MALSELGADIGPLIAGAGIVGIALGFGAQTLVRDFLSGLFMLFEAAAEDAKKNCPVSQALTGTTITREASLVEG